MKKKQRIASLMDALLQAVKIIPDKWIGGRRERTLLKEVERGRSYGQIAEMLGVTYEMAQYFVRRLVNRYSLVPCLIRGLRILREHKHELFLLGMTRKQYAVAKFLLSGKSQTEAAVVMGITQAAVSSRFRYADEFIHRVAGTLPWAKPLSGAMVVRRKSTSLISFQQDRIRRSVASSGGAD